MPNASHLGHYLVSFFLLSYYYAYSQHSVSVDSEHLALTTHTLPIGDPVIMSGMYPIQTTQRLPPRFKKKITNKKQEVTRNLANIFKKKICPLEIDLFF